MSRRQISVLNLILSLIITLEVYLVNAQSPLTLANVVISFANDGTKTRFNVSSPQSGIARSPSWFGVGLNSGSGMSGASVIVCKYDSANTANTRVQHYYNTGYSSDLLDASNPLIGLTETSIGIDPSNPNNLLCRFARDNSNANSRYYNLNGNSPYVLAAYGTLQATGG